MMHMCACTNSSTRFTLHRQRQLSKPLNIKEAKLTLKRFLAIKKGCGKLEELGDNGVVISLRVGGLRKTTVISPSLVADVCKICELAYDAHIHLKELLESN